MTLVDILWAVALFAGGVGAAVAHLAREGQTPPLRGLWSWLTWSVLSASATSCILIQLNNGAEAALLWGLIAGPIVPPVVTAWLLLEDKLAFREMARANRLQPDPHASGLEEMRYHATDFDGLKPPPVEPWAAVAPQPPPAPAARAERPPLARIAALAAGVALWVGFTLAADFAREPPRLEKVRAYLSLMGFDDAHVWRAQVSADCWGGQEYDWRAEPGEGRACVRDGDYVTVEVLREHWSDDPFARPLL